MTPFAWAAFVLLYLLSGWLFAREVQKQFDINTTNGSHAVIMLALFLGWPAFVLFMILVVLMTLLFPNPEKK